MSLQNKVKSPEARLRQLEEQVKAALSQVNSERQQVAPSQGFLEFLGSLMFLHHREVALLNMLYLIENGSEQPGADTSWEDQDE